MLRHLLSAACIAIAASATGQTLYPGGIAGCVARFPFSNPEGTGTLLTDVSGNANHGTPNNITPASGWRGMPNTAGKFNGTSSYGNVPFAANLNLTNLTQVALIKFDGFYSGECQANMILSRGDGFGSGVYTMNVGDAGYDNDCYSFDSMHQMRGDYVGNNFGVGVPATTPIQTGKWYFFAGTFDGSTYKAYQILMDSNVLLPTLSPAYQLNGLSAMGTSSEPLMIGAGVNPRFPYWFNGVMDEVAIFNRALTSAELQKIYASMLRSANNLSVGSEQQAPVGVQCLAEAGQLSLKAIDGKAIGQVLIINMQGQLIGDKAINAPLATVDMSAYPKGLLLVSVKRNGTIITTKVTNL